MKKFLCLAAVSIAVFAQAASAQQTTPPGGLKVTLKSVQPGMGVENPTTVTTDNGTVWTFGRRDNIISKAASIGVNAVEPRTLTAGLQCTLQGRVVPPASKNDSPNQIDSLVCQAPAPVAVIAKPAFVPGKYVTGVKIIIKNVKPGSAGNPTTVTGDDGTVWTFGMRDNIQSKAARVGATFIEPRTLTAGLKCGIQGTPGTPRGNEIDYMGCEQ